MRFCGRNIVELDLCVKVTSFNHFFCILGKETKQTPFTVVHALLFVFDIVLTLQPLLLTQLRARCAYVVILPFRR